MGTKKSSINLMADKSMAGYGLIRIVGDSFGLVELALDLIGKEDGNRINRITIYYIIF